MSMLNSRSPPDMKKERTDSFDEKAQYLLRKMIYHRIHFKENNCRKIAGMRSIQSRHMLLRLQLRSIVLYRILACIKGLASLNCRKGTD